MYVPYKASFTVEYPKYKEYGPTPKQHEVLKAKQPQAYKKNIIILEQYLNIIRNLI